MVAAPSSQPKKKPALTPPDQPVSVRPDRRKNVIILLITLVFILLATLLAGVLFLLPEKIAETEIQPPAAPPAMEEMQQPGQTAPPIPPEDGEVAEEPPEKSEALAKLEMYLQRKSEMELEQVHLWGGGEYEAILQLAQRGDNFLRQTQYGEAAAAYEDAFLRIQKLGENKLNIYQESLQRGEEYLNNLDGKNALEQFRVATAIDPESGAALQGLKRAENLDQVLHHYEAGKVHENNEELEKAIAEYRKSSALDPYFQPASDAVIRLEDELKQQRLNEALKVFHLSMQQGQLQPAYKALQTAVSIAPYDQAVVNAQEQYDSAIETAEIRRLQEQAETAGRNEDWKTALSAYEKILKRAPQADFARRGAEIAKNYAELDQRLDFHLQNTMRLQNDEVLHNAEDILRVAKNHTDLGKKMSAKVSALSDAVTRAKIRVTLLLRSDNATEVAIYHVGRMGRFLTKEVVLKPGRYTITGERAGFRAVRHVLDIGYEASAVEFTIVCREPI